MALTLGTDTYISLANADAYFATHPRPTTWDAATDAAKEAALRQAAYILDRLHYKGEVASETQALAWPRYGVVDKDGREIGETVYPDQLERAACELALEILTTDVEADSDTEGVKRVRAGSVEVEYTDGGAPSRQLPLRVTREIVQFLKTAGFSAPTHRS